VFGYRVTWPRGERHHLQALIGAPSLVRPPPSWALEVRHGPGRIAGF